MGGGDFNAAFSFESGGVVPEAPWEFTDAIAQSRKPTGSTRQTTVDQKIKHRLSEKKAAKDAKKAARRSIPVARPPSDSDRDSDSDVPLPGEDVSDSASNPPSSGSDTDPEEASSEVESEEERPPASPSRSGPALRGSVGAPAQDDDSSGSEASLTDSESQSNSGSDEEEESGEELQAVVGPSSRALRNEHPTPGVEHPSSSDDDDAYGGPRRSRNGSSGGGRAAGFFETAPASTSFEAQSFANLNLSRPLVKACAALGYEQPTPIQAACIPLAMSGRDIVGSAITGSGKTAAFALPVLERLLHRQRRVAVTYVLILAPTRELAAQIHSMLQKLAQFTDVRAALVVGGLSVSVQAATLRTGPEVIVATPGRLIDHVRNTQSVGLEDLSTLILDEADRLLEMGFAEEIKEIVRMAPTQRQTLLFSATMTEGVKELVQFSLKHPVRLAADPHGKAPRELEQEVIRIKGGAVGDKDAILLASCSRSWRDGRTIIFFRTKAFAHRMKIVFGLAGLPPAAELHGDMTQAARLEALEAFRKGEVAFLLCTDVAARGLDIIGVEIVVNYDAPKELATYVHRVGRTARAGKRGKSVTFIEDGDRGLVKDIMKKTASKLSARVVPAQAVTLWKGKVERLQGDVFKVLKEEREEKNMRKAEMEATKAFNMIEHHEEIMNRPPRTWFQTPREKAAQQEAAREAVNGPSEAAQEEKKRSKEEKRRERKAAKAIEAKKRKRSELEEETDDIKVTRVKGIKTMERQLRQQGMMPSEAGKAAASRVTGVKRNSDKSKAKGKEGAGGDGSGGLFDGDGTTHQRGGKSKVYAGGGSSGNIIKPGSGKSKSVTNKIKRGGSGKSQFKSRQKYKRR